jgi:PAS domain S-box-containing protein
MGSGQTIYSGQERSMTTRQKKSGQATGMGFSASCSGKPGHDAEHRSTGLTANRGTTGQHRAQSALRESEERYRLLAETMLQGVIHQNADGTIISLNPAAERILGKSREELLGGTSAQVEHLTIRENGERFPGREHPAMRALQTGRPVTDVVMGVFNPKLEAYRWININAVPVYREHDTSPSEVYAVFEDITERRRACEELVTLNRELESRVAARTSELAVSIAKLQTEIAERDTAEECLLRLNRLYLVLSKTSHAIVRTKTQESLFESVCRIAVEDGGFLLAWVGLLQEGGSEVQKTASFGATGYLQEVGTETIDDLFAMGPSGTSVCTGTCCICNDFAASPRPWHERGAAYGLRASASVPLKLGGKLIGALTLYAGEKDFFDRQETALLQQMGADLSFALKNFNQEALRREAERALQAETAELLLALESLREKDRMLIQQSRQAAMGEMISNIAHQWRQPLNTLALAVQELRFMFQIGECTEDFMKENVDKAMGMIQHMSQTIDDFRNYFRPDREKSEFQLTDAVRQTLLLVEDSFKHQRVEIDIVTLQAPLIFGYRNEYAQALLNILNNARDVLTERAVKHPRVAITLSSEGGRAVLTVADNAGGIPTEIIGKIFDPYFTTKGPQAGTGLGLFMSKTIIEKNLAGRLTVRNTGDGAEFRIEV